MKYQDLVIKDGKFVGKFEKMYQEVTDPWGQSRDFYYSSLSRRSICYFLEKFDIRFVVIGSLVSGSTGSVALSITVCIEFLS